MAKDEFSGITAQSKAGKHRLRDGEVLRAGKRWLGAMYLAGYSVECLLKAKLMQRFRCQDLRELEEYLRSKRLMRRADTIFSHQLYFLLRLTGAIDRLRMNQQVWRPSQPSMNGSLLGGIRRVNALAKTRTSLLRQCAS